MSKSLFLEDPLIQKRDPRTSLLPRNGVVSYGAQIEGFRVFADHARENKRKKNAPTIFARRAAFHACLFSRSERSTYTPDVSRLF